MVWLVSHLKATCRRPPPPCRAYSAPTRRHQSGLWLPTFALQQQYPGARLLWTGDWSTFDERGMWVTVAGDAFPDSSGALAWCTRNHRDPEHCYAKIVSTTHPIEGSTAHN